MHGIDAAIARARRRMRLQAALELATAASVATSAVIVVAVFLVRRGLIGEATGWLLGGVGVAIPVVAGLWAFARRLPLARVATRIDRASGLSDRLASAAAFRDELTRGAKEGRPPDPDTVALMEAAIADAVRNLPRANVKAAAPFAWPRELRPALAFGVVAAVVTALYFPDADAVPRAPVATHHEDLVTPKAPVTLDDEDVEYAQDLLDELRDTAKRTGDEHLQKFADDVDALLKKAQNGQLSKEQLLDQLAKLESKYMEGSNQDVEQAKKDLERTGRELAKAAETRALGKALQEGNLEQARKEFEKLADQMERGELNKQQKERIAKAMEKAAKEFEKVDQKRDEKEQQEEARLKKKVEEMQRRRDQEKDPEKREAMTKRIDEKKRELKQLQRRRNERKMSQQGRALKELHRNMKKAAEQMRQQQNQSSQQQQAQQKLAARTLRRAAKDTGKVDREQRKVTNQKKVASQLTDLREAMRRARRKGGNGQRDLFGKNRRNQDFRRRARGGKSSRGAWKPGQALGQGQGKKPGQGQGQGQGQGPGGNDYGDGHDPNIMGDPTAMQGNTKDADLQGIQGKGPSTRETILTSAQKGFSGRAYQSVYARYKTIVEEVIRAEKVPSGYKFYVKRYFQKIKPN